MAKSNHNKYVSYPDWFGSSTTQPAQQQQVTQTVYYGSGGSSSSSGGTGLTGVITQGSGNAVTSGTLDGNMLVLNKDLTFATDQSSTNTFWELREDLNGKSYLYANYDIATLGGHTMYANGDDTLSLPGLYDGLPIDGNTIYWEETEEGRVLKAKFNEDVGVDASEVLSIVYNAGYATQNWVNNQNFVTNSFLASELSKYVSLGEEYQEIEGVKNFLNGLQIAGLPITKLNGYEDVIYIDANVVIRGGLTMYYEDGEIDLPTIKNEIGNAGYDGVTGLASFNSSQFSISRDGTVTIIGGSTGLDTAQLKEYLDNNKYTTETWVKAQGYASESSLSSLQTKVNNFLEGSDTDTIINKWKELEAFLSGLSESDNLATILSTKWTTDNSLINKWNTAYGWGNHASVGYALKSYVDSNFVTLGTKQTITGEKNFTGGLKVNGSPIYYDATNKYWKLEGDLLVTGGVSMYSDDSAFEPSTIMDGVVVDGTTIRKNPTSGALEVIGDGGSTIKYPLSWSGFNQGSYDGSQAVSFYIPTKLSEFVNDKNFATASALSGYLPTSGGTINGSLVISNENWGTQLTINRHNSDGRTVINYTNSNNGLLGHIGVGGSGNGSNAYQPIFYDKNKTEYQIYHSGNLTPTEILTQLKTVDGSGSGLDADLLDGKQPSELNVGSATKLQTARTIWGQSFDGTGDVDKTLHITKCGNGTYVEGIRINTLNGDYSSVWFNTTNNKDYDAGMWGITAQKSTGSLRFRGGDSTLFDLMTIKQNGNVLIGTTIDSGQKLRVDGSIYANNYGASGNSSVASIIINKSGNPFGIGTSANKSNIRFGKCNGDATWISEWMTITDDGKIGINITSPAYYLDVNGTARIDGIPIYKKQDGVLYIEGNLAVKGGITMFSEDEIDIPSIIDSLPIASNSEKGIASFDSTYFSVDSNGMVSLTSAPSSGASSLGELLNVDASIDATASVDRVLYQPAGSATWTWRELPKDGVVGDYLPLSGGTMTGGVVIAPSASYTTSITDKCTVLKLGSDTSGMNGYNSGLGFNALQRYRSNYLLHLHAWIGLSPCINSAGSELYDLVFATNGSTTVNTSPIERMRITNDGSVKIQRLFFGNTNEINSTDGSFLCLNYEGTGGILMSNNAQGVVVSSNWNGLSGKTQQRLRQSMFSVRGGIFSYMEDVISNAAAYVFDKPGQYFTGIGSNGETDTIYFGAVDTSNNYSWVSYSQKWKFGGSIITTGGITMYSDIRKKTILNNVELSLKDIANAPLIEHYYNSDQNKTNHVGSIAQYWAELNDWFCKLDVEGFYTMEIQNCALASAISIARHLERYESKTDKAIHKMRQRIQELEDEVERLKNN